MFVKQFYNKPSRTFSYFIEDNGEAIVIDPFRNTEPYTILANERSVNIKYVFETQFHTEFISGHIDLANAFGATVVFGPNALTEYKSYTAFDGEIFSFGDLAIKVFHTSGYSIENACYLLLDQNKNAISIFTGYTLLIGEICKIDFFKYNHEYPISILAAMLFDSLNIKLGVLNDDIIVYPSYSSKFKLISSTNVSFSGTVGKERMTNFGLIGLDKDDFIQNVNMIMEEQPKYSLRNAELNRKGYVNINDVVSSSFNSISLNDFALMSKNDDIVIIDSRQGERLVNGFIPNSININLEEHLEMCSTGLIPMNKKILLLTDFGREKETIIELANIGFDNIIGFLDGGFDSWIDNKEIDLIINVEVDELLLDIPYDENLVVLDVRHETVYAQGHLKQSINIPIGNLSDVGSMVDFDDKHNIYVLSDTGEISITACTLLKRQGIHNVRNISGGWKSIIELESSFTIEQSKQPENGS